jgi:hypothetical protein
MTLCFVDPADAIRAIADSVGREARRQLLGEAVRAWVDEIPDGELTKEFTGISDPYEAPKHAELVLDTENLDVDYCAQQVILKLENMGLIRA